MELEGFGLGRYNGQHVPCKDCDVISVSRYAVVQTRKVYFANQTSDTIEERRKYSLFLF